MSTVKIEQAIFSALGIKQGFQLSPGPSLHSCFAVTDLAVASIAAVGCAMGDFLQSVAQIDSEPPGVDRRLASMWFAQSLYPIGWPLPPVWDAIAGIYQCSDGWIRLHTNLAHHRQAALQVIGTKAVRDDVQQALLNWKKDALESAIVEKGGVAAAMRSNAQWQNHPHGSCLKDEPLVDWHGTSGRSKAWKGTPQRPLKGLKVLDMTRVLAGPVATRTLAGLGANVLRIDPPNWQEDNVVPDIMLGKRSGFLDLGKPHGMKILSDLITEADVFVHGYRADALDGLGFTKEYRELLNPELVEVSLNAYGWSGPWANRRGFDSLVQMSSGIAEAGMQWVKSQHPTPLPVQALDHATGYLMAAAVIKALELAITHGEYNRARLSLAKTAELLKAFAQCECEQLDPTFTPDDANEVVEHTPWGRANRLKSPLKMSNVKLHWKRPASELGAYPLNW